MSNSWHQNDIDKDLLSTIENVMESKDSVSAQRYKEDQLSDSKFAQLLVDAVKKNIKSLKMDKTNISIDLNRIKVSELNDFVSGKLDSKKINTYAYMVADKVTRGEGISDRHKMLRDSLSTDIFTKLVGTPVMNLVVQEAKRRNII